MTLYQHYYRHRQKIGVFICMLVLMGTSAMYAESTTPSSTSWIVGEHLIGSIPDNYDALLNTYLSPDGQTAAFHVLVVEGLHTYHVLVIDGIEDWRFDNIRDISFSHDDSTVNFIGTYNNHDIFIIRKLDWDWKNQLSRTTGGTKPPKNMKDWSQLNYPFAHTFIAEKHMTLNGTSFLYSANDGGDIDKPLSDRGGKWSLRINLNGIEDQIKLGSAPSELTLATQGNTYAYVIPKRDKYVVCKEKTMHKKTYQNITHLQLSDDGEHLLYMAREDNGEIVVFDTEESPVYDKIIDATLDITGTKVAYAARSAGSSFVVFGSSKEQNFDDIAHLTFSPDGEHLAYTGEKEGSWHIIVDKKPIASYKKVNKLLYSKDSQHLTWQAQDNGLCKTFVDNREVFSNVQVKNDSFAFGPHDQIGCIIMLSGHNHTATAATSSCAENTPGVKEFVAVGSWQGRWYDEILTTPQFSPDGTKISYGARQSSDILWVCDDIPQEPVEEIPSTIGRPYAPLTRQKPPINK